MAKVGGGFCGRASTRGFTLVEFMVVVVIVGVLATVGVSLLRNHVFASKSAEALSSIQAIRGAQERWRAETSVYLDVSGDPADTKWYPMATPSGEKHAWDNPSGNDYDNWRLLDPGIQGPVQFGYQVKAGAPGEAPPALLSADQPTWGTLNEPWYIIHCKADADANGVSAYFIATSITESVVTVNVGE